MGGRSGQIISGSGPGLSSLTPPQAPQGPHAVLFHQMTQNPNPLLEKNKTKPNRSTSRCGVSCALSEDTGIDSP